MERNSESLHKTAVECEPQEVPLHLLESLLDVINREIYSKEDNQNAHLLNLYLWGSRVSGTHHEKTSDWDFLAIVAQYKQPDLVQAIDSSVKHPSLGEDEVNFGVCIYSDEYFQWLLDQHVPWALPLVFHPRGAVLMEKKTFSFQLEIQRLRRGIKLNTEVNLKQAKSAFQLRDERRRGLKRIYHVMQMIDWSNQIINHDRVVLRASCNHFYYHMLDCLELTSSMDSKAAWKAFCEVWQPILSHLEQDFEYSATLYQRFEAEWEREIPLEQSQSLRLPGGQVLPVKGLCVLAFIQKYGIHNLTKYLSIQATPSSACPSQLLLTFSRVFTPSDSRIGSECNGLIVELQPETRSTELSFLPVPRFHNAGNESSIPINLLLSQRENTQIYEFLDGRFVSLFLHNGEWKLASMTSPDASELVNGEKCLKDYFWIVWNELALSLPGDEFVDICFIFQLILKDHPIIFPYDNNNIVLVAARNKRSLEDVDIFGDTISTLSLPLPRTMPMELLSNKKSQSNTKVTQSDILQEEINSRWQNAAGWIVRTELPGGVFGRTVALSQIVSGLTQIRFASRQQQESTLLQLFSLYSWYKHPILERCPFLAGNQENNCCLAFEYVKERFERLCNDIDQKVKLLSETCMERKDFALQAEQRYSADLHWIMWTKYKASSCREMFAREGKTTAVSCALTAWWSKNHKTPFVESNKHFCYKC